MSIQRIEWFWIAACVAMTIVSALGGYSAGENAARHDLRPQLSIGPECVPPQKVVRAVVLDGACTVRLEVTSGGDK